MLLRVLFSFTLRFVIIQRSYLLVYVFKNLFILLSLCQCVVVRSVVIRIECCYCFPDMTSSMANVNNFGLLPSDAFCDNFPIFVTVFNIHMSLIILKVDDKQFTLITKKTFAYHL